MTLRRSPLRAVSEKRQATLEAEGRWSPFTTFAKATAAAAKTAVVMVRRRDTGPDAATKALLAKRSGGRCEWPGCTQRATDRHHRLNRKVGGRHGEAAVRLNRLSWLLDCCRFHHQYVTSAYGLARMNAVDWGWVLYEGDDATQAPVRTRHDRLPVLLTDAGSWMWTRDGIRYFDASTERDWL